MQNQKTFSNIRYIQLFICKIVKIVYVTKYANVIANLMINSCLEDFFNKKKEIDLTNIAEKNIYLGSIHI